MKSPFWWVVRRADGMYLFRPDVVDEWTTHASAAYTFTHRGDAIDNGMVLGRRIVRVWARGLTSGQRATIRAAMAPPPHEPQPATDEAPLDFWTDIVPTLTDNRLRTMLAFGRLTEAQRDIVHGVLSRRAQEGGAK